jgi:hypothetical protein
MRTWTDKQEQNAQRCAGEHDGDGMSSARHEDEQT